VNYRSLFLYAKYVITNDVLKRRRSNEVEVPIIKTNQSVNSKLKKERKFI
jgi:hypothetical protein